MSNSFAWLRKIEIIFIPTCLFLTLSFASAYSQKNTEKFKDNRGNGFFHTLNFSVNLNKGNEEYFKYQGDYRIDYNKNNFITYIVGNLEYKEGNNRLITNKGFAHFRFIYNKDKLIEPELFAQIDYNDFIFLKERYLAGAGLRFIITDTYTNDSLHRLSIESGVGAMYEYEKVDDIKKPVTKYIRSTNFLNIRYSFNKSFNFYAVAYYQPYINDFIDYRFLNENRVSFSITKHFAFFVNTILRYDNEPIRDLKKYDLELSNGITITF